MNVARILKRRETRRRWKLRLNIAKQMIARKEVTSDVVNIQRMRQERASILLAESRPSSNGSEDSNQWELVEFNADDSCDTIDILPPCGETQAVPVADQQDARLDPDVGTPPHNELYYFADDEAWCSSASAECDKDEYTHDIEITNDNLEHTSDQELTNDDLQCTSDRELTKGDLEQSTSDIKLSDNDLQYTSDSECINNDLEYTSDSEGTKVNLKYYSNEYDSESDVYSSSEESINSEKSTSSFLYDNLDSESTCSVSDFNTGTSKIPVLYTGSHVTSHECCVALLSMLLKHSLTNSSIKDMLNLLSQILPPDSNLPTSHHLLLKQYVNFQDQTTIHKCCGYCTRLLPGVDNPKCSNIDCQSPSTSLSSFIEISLDKQLTTLFSGYQSIIDMTT